MSILLPCATVAGIYDDNSRCHSMVHQMLYCIFKDFCSIDSHYKEKHIFYNSCYQCAVAETIIYIQQIIENFRNERST